jgi:hypothetical protein
VKAFLSNCCAGCIGLALAMVLFPVLCYLVIMAYANPH